MSEDIVRVLRVYEFVGPRKEVEAQVERSIQGTRAFNKGLSIRGATVGAFPDLFNPQEGQRQVQPPPDPKPAEGAEEVRLGTEVIVGSDNTRLRVMSDGDAYGEGSLFLVNTSTCRVTGFLRVKVKESCGAKLREFFTDGQWKSFHPRLAEGEHA